MSTPTDPFLLLGVMSNPVKPILRTQWREWASGFRENDRAVRVRYVFGKTMYERGADPGSVRVNSMIENQSDHLLVDSREKLPHVGVVTEKSAYFWRTAASTEPAAKWYCKCDDDTLVHLDRLTNALKSIEALHPGEESYMGHIKWRGWDVDGRFQACGGTWGDARKAATDILEGGIEHGTKRYPPCPHAAGPYPYMSGGMVCMSRPLALRMATDEHFEKFLALARTRNTHGTPCKRPQQCAAQPADVHMWHHEDAGIGFNVFRAAVAGNAKLNYIAVPAHYNDAGIIERSEPLSPADEYWSTRAVFAHGIKIPAHFRLIKRKWTLSRPDAVFSTLQCWPADTLPRGANIHYGHWSWARAPCGPQAVIGDGPHNFCNVTPGRQFRFCAVPWVIPAAMRNRTGAAEAALKAQREWTVWRRAQDRKAVKTAVRAAKRAVKKRIAKRAARSAGEESAGYQAVR